MSVLTHALILACFGMEEEGSGGAPEVDKLLPTIPSVSCMNSASAASGTASSDTAASNTSSAAAAPSTADAAEADAPAEGSDAFQIKTSRRRTGTAPTPPPPPPQPVPSLRLPARRQRAAPRHPPRTSILLALLLWAASVPLGLLDISAPNMFSNLRAHGGSNHILGLPTGMLQRLSSASQGPSASTPSMASAPTASAPTAAAPTAATPTAAVLLVDHTTSSYIRSVHPAEVSDLISPSARALLRAIGHSGRQWHSALSRVVGPFALPPQPASPAKYTLPALEVRRVLAEAAALSRSGVGDDPRGYAHRGSGFSLSVRWLLPGTEGDETRRRAQAKRSSSGTAKQQPKAVAYTISFDGVEFRCRRGRWLSGRQCSPSEAATLLPGPAGRLHAATGQAAGMQASVVGWLLAFPQAWKSMPLLDADDAEVHCG